MRLRLSCTRLGKRSKYGTYLPKLLSIYGRIDKQQFWFHIALVFVSFGFTLDY